jgi:hypothetical protein
VNGRVLSLARYRFAATWRARFSAYLTLVLLIGAVGGLAMGAVAGARRTQSSYPALLASTNPGDVGLGTAILDPAFGNGAGYDPALVGRLTRLPHVEWAASEVGLDIAPLSADGAPRAGSGSYLPVSAGNGFGSVGGAAFTRERLVVTQGRLPGPDATNEFVTLAQTVTAFGWHLGEVIPMGIYTNAQTESPGFGTARVRPYRRMNLRLVGIAQPSTSIIEDDADFSTELGWFTPALTRPLVSCCVNFTETLLKVRDPAVNLPGVEIELSKLSIPEPHSIPLTYGDVNAIATGKAERANKPLSLALGVFGAIAMLAALLIAGQFLGRQLRLRANEADALRALGASPAMLSADGLLGLLGAITIGAVLAVLVAVALSPLAPLGPVRPVYPSPGIAFDWTVLGLGFVIILVGLGAVAGTLAYRGAPHRVAARARLQGERPSGVSAAAASLGLPVPAATGVRFALESGSGRSAVPVRSAILGAALAVLVVVATVTFGASLDTLISTPKLYGWNWNYLLYGGGGSGDIPQGPAIRALSHDHDIAHFSGVYFGLQTLDGQAVPDIGTTPGTSVQPPVLTGHGLEGPRQVVLGALTLLSLHKHLGQSVTLGEGNGRSARLEIVGTATMPTLGSIGAQHLEMGQGAVLSAALIPAALKNPFHDKLSGPEGFFVQFRPGVNTKDALAGLDRIAKPLSNTDNFGVFPTGVLRPAEIVDYRSMGTTPAILGASLGAGAAVALGLTLLASVRRRRRDLALLKTLGFTRPQLGLTVAIQSTVAVAIGTVVGVPLGIVVGRVLWDLFAGSINAVQQPTVPVVTVVLIALGALVLANAVAALPGRLAARTPTALLLRAE